MVRVSVLGGSGYAGGELVRLLLAHPVLELAQVTSERSRGRFVHSVHPNLRGATDLRFCAPADLEPSDVLFLAQPHGHAAENIDRVSSLAPRLVDLSADFRLRDHGDYQRWYGSPHAAPDWLERFVYGLPELHRGDLAGAEHISGVGCNATAVNLALLPLARSGLLERAVVDLKVGSSEGGNRSSAASHHPERSGALRSFAPTGHRHQAEVLQELGPFELHFSATAIEAVRGVLCTAHAFLNEELEEKDLWRLFRESYDAEPFVRLVKESRGLFRYPEPKLLAGTNFCDVGFASDPGTRRVVVISALDNLVKGAAGTAVQALNVALGFEESAGLNFVGLHPV